MRLDEAVNVFVVQRKWEGFAFEDGERWLRALSKAHEESDLRELSMQDVAAFLDGCSRTARARHTKFRVLSCFFDYWECRGETPPLLVPERRSSDPNFLPYVYKTSEMQALVDACVESRLPLGCAVHSRMLRTLIVLLWGVGASPGEMRRLRRNDVLMGKRFIKLQSSRSGMRRIPISREIVEILRQHIAWQLEVFGSCDYLFVTRHGDRLSRTHISRAFARLCRTAGVRRSDGVAMPPRLQDFRATFAVRRIAQWIKDGANLNTMLPALASYVGRKSLLAGEQYLHMTPERFRKQLVALHPLKHRSPTSGEG